MNRDLKAKSVRLSGIFDLFSEEKTGLEYNHSLKDNSGEKSPRETKEKKVNLFSFRKKCESDSKVYEKRKSKPFFRYLSSDHSSSEAKSLKGREESTEYEGAQFTPRKPLKLDRNLKLNQNNTLESGQSWGKVSLDASFSMDRSSCEQVENLLSSAGEISPTVCKGLVTSKRQKFFRFSSKQKVKPVETATTGLSHYLSSSHCQISDDKDMKDISNVNTEILQSMNNCEDVLLISHGESVKRIRSEGSCEELGPVMTVNSDLSLDLFAIEGNEKCPETVSKCKMFAVCSRSSKDVEDDRIKKTTDMSKNIFKKYFGFLTLLIRNLLIFLRSYLVLSTRFILYLPLDILLVIKAMSLFISGSCGRIHSSIKVGFRRICGNKPEESPKLQNQIDTVLLNDINFDSSQEIIDRISRYEPQQGNQVDNHINESESDIASKESKAKWRRFLRQWSKDGRQKLNKGNSASDYAEPEDVKWSTDFETVQIQGNHIVSESLKNPRDTDIIMTMDSKRRSSLKSFISFIQKAFDFLLSVILFIPMNATYVLQYFFSKISSVVFRHPIQLRKASAVSINQVNSFDLKDSRLNNRFEKVNSEKIKCNYSLNVSGLIKKQKAGAEREMIKDNANYSDTIGGFSHEMNLCRTRTIRFPTLEPKVLMRKIISFFGVLFHFTGLCFITLFSLLWNIIARFFAIIKLLFSIIIRLAFLPFVLLGKILFFLFKCIRYLLQFPCTIILGVIKTFCLVILLVLSLPIVVIVIAKISLCFLIDICWKCCVTALRFVNTESMMQIQADSEENANTELERSNEIYCKAQGKQGGKIDKILKKLHVNALFKKRKKSPESSAFSAEHSQLRYSLASTEHESISPMKQEPKAYDSQSDLKRGCMPSKLFSLTVESFSRVLFFILALPLGIVAIFRLIFRSLTSFLKIYPCNRHSVSDQESSPKNFASNASYIPGESNHTNPAIHFQTANTKLHRSNSEGGYIGACSTDGGNLQTNQSFENLAKKAVTSVSENTVSKENEGNKCSFDPRPYLKLTFPFFRVFFHLQSIFVAALWHRIDVMASSIVKVILLGILHLTPSGVIKWTALVAIRFTPGVKNRKILLTFLEETPSKITKRAIETYVRKVPIGVMMTHARVTLKDSSSKTVVKCVSMVLKNVTKTTESVFMSVSGLLKQVSKKLRIQKHRETSSLKERVLIRLKSEDGGPKKRHDE